MFLHQSVYLDQNLHHAGYPAQMPQDRKIQHVEEMYVNMHIWLANWWFGNIVLRNWDQLGHVVCPANVASALELAVCVGLVEVHFLLCVSSVSVDCLGCHFGKHGIQTWGFDESQPGVFVSLPSPFYAQETQHPASSLLRPQREVSWFDISFPWLRHVNTLPWPFWPYSRSGACRTVPAVPDLLALP